MYMQYLTGLMEVFDLETSLKILRDAKGGSLTFALHKNGLYQQYMDLCLDQKALK